MTLARRYTLVSACLLLASLDPGAGGTPPSPGSRAPYDLGRLQWKKLEYKARKLVLSAASEVELEVVPGKEFPAGLLSFGDEDLTSAETPGVILRLQSHFLGRDSLTELWLEPQSGQAIQRIHTDSGKRHRQKTYRFGRAGVRAERRVPARQEEEQLPPAQWTKTSDAYYTYPEGLSGPVTEPSSLFFLLAVLDAKTLEGGVEVATFSRDRLNAALLRLEGREEIKVDYVAQTPSGSEIRKGPVEALHVSLRARSLAGDEQDNNLQLLGLEGDIDLYLDPDFRFPLQIQGKIPPAGGVTVRLQRVELSSP